MTFACTYSVRINESETFVFVYVFTQPDSSNVRRKRPHTSLSRHDEQPLNPAVPGASTSAAANEVKHFNYCFLVQTQLEILTNLDKVFFMIC